MKILVRQYILYIMEGKILLYQKMVLDKQKLYNLQKPQNKMFWALFCVPRIVREA